jgi:glycosyltransferase involved in cell wall biosynthesis
MLKFSLSKADYLLSTSYAMAEEGKKYTKKKFYITPFGVDMDLFNPNKRTRDDDEFVIGTVKSLKKKYGIEYLLKASAIIRKNNPNLNMRVKIAGKGPEEEELKQLAAKLKIENIVDWLGFISQERAASEWANMDVAVVPSILDSESFGVSAVEAEACGVPVIISDVPGLMEATNPAKSSLVVHRKDENELAEAILKLAQNPSYRKDMGKNGRIFVVEKYELNICFNNIEKVFIETMKNTSQN